MKTRRSILSLIFGAAAAPAVAVAAPRSMTAMGREEAEARGLIPVSAPYRRLPDDEYQWDPPPNIDGISNDPRVEAVARSLTLHDPADLIVPSIRFGRHPSGATRSDAQGPPQPAWWHEVRTAKRVLAAADEITFNLKLKHLESLLLNG